MNDHASNLDPLPDRDQALSFADATAVLERLAGALSPAGASFQEVSALLSQPTPAPAHLGPGERAEFERRKAEARYRALVEQIPAVTFMAPLDGTVSQLYVSPQIESLLGFTAREWLDDPVLWFKQLHPDDKDRWQAEFARTVNSATHFRAEYRFIARNGRTVWVHGEAKVVSDDQGRPMFLQGVAFDITESKEAEESLRKVNADLTRARDQALEASRAKSAFLANMSHELRTPLNAIIGYSEILQEDVVEAGDEQYQPDLQKIHSSSKHLLGLINDVLDLSKVEAGRMELFVEEFTVREMIDEVVSTVAPLVEKNRNTLQLDVGEIGQMRGDKTRVRQVLFNLLSNASKFTHEGTVTVAARKLLEAGREWIEISVADTGIGIAPEQVVKLFHDFTQVDDTSTRKFGGTGLGLAICRRFCRLMDGDVRVESEAGRGSTFTIRLPVAAGPPSGEGSAELLEIPGTIIDDRRELILAIDDDPAALDLMRRYLGREGFRVAGASSGEEGLRLARELRPAAITLDVMMPGMDGWKVLTALKGDRDLADIPVVIVTMVGDKNLGFALGASAFLNKHIDRRQLSATLARFHTAFNVLVVDDDNGARELTSRILADMGCHVITAANGRLALAALAVGKPDLVLLDLLMPEMDGFEFLEEFRRNAQWREVPVVVLTALELTREERDRLNSRVVQLYRKGDTLRTELTQHLRTVIGSRAPARAGESV